MFDTIVQPTDVDQLIGIVKESPRVLPVGNRTKPALSHRSGATIVSMTGITGMVDYEPSEFTFTAMAGTTIAEIAAALEERGQYLPFDPMLVDAGATLGGTIASGISGPGRFRYGGLRDFLLGAQVVTGDGQVVNVGSRVVKNAAGFDVPKLLVGSVGRFGIITRATMKVFPRPAHQLTLKVPCQNISQVIDRIAYAARSRWECDAIDYRHDESSLWLRLAGPHAANTQLADAISNDWKTPVQTLDSFEGWAAFRELDWADGAATILRVPISLSRYAIWHRERSRRKLSGTTNASSDSPQEIVVKEHLSVAGDVLWLAIKERSAVDNVVRLLTELKWSFMFIRADEDLGIDAWRSVVYPGNAAIHRHVFQALDPSGKFGSR